MIMNLIYNKMFNVDEEGIQLSSITGKFVTLDDDNYIKEVEMSENYHHQRQIPRSVLRYGSYERPCVRYESYRRKRRS